MLPGETTTTLSLFNQNSEGPSEAGEGENEGERKRCMTDGVFSLTSRVLWAACVPLFATAHRLRMRSSPPAASRVNTVQTVILI